MTSTRGIDVSVWNGDINWKKVKSDDISFAMIRVAAATYPDRRFNQNIEGALKAGIHCGVYLYSYATTPDMARAEAEFALKMISPYTLTYPIIFDIEDKVHHGLSNQQRTEIIKAFCDTISASGHLTGIYASLWWFQTMFDLPQLSLYDKWIAQWSSACTFTEAYTMWQFSNIGRIDGIIGDVDLNYVYKDYPSLYANMSPPATVPTKPTAPIKPPKPTTPPSIPSATYSVGTKLSLKGVKMFSAASKKLPSGFANGTYWVYDGQSVNGRIRITNQEQNVRLRPMSKYVTGFISINDITVSVE